MSLKLRHERTTPSELGEASPGAPPRPDAAGGQAPMSIGGWLGVLATMLPRRQAGAIREELEGHLQERVRDLMVGGMGEAEATKRAIEELGEAAELAGKYRALSSEPQRRLVMYGMILAVAGAGLALSVAAVNGVGRQPQNETLKAKAAVKEAIGEVLIGLQPVVEGGQTLVLRPQIVRDVPILAEVQQALVREYRVQPSATELGELRMDVQFERTPAAEVFSFVGEKAGMPVQVNWMQLSEMGLNPKSPVTLRAKAVGADVVLRAINEAAEAVQEDRVDWRAANGVIEVAGRNHFDRREITLVIYDLDGIIAARQEKYNEQREKIVEEVTKLVWQFVSPTGWTENGGDVAKLTVVGDRMFVEAPERFHKQIGWMLEQLPGQKGEGRGATSPEIETRK